MKILLDIRRIDYYPYSASMSRKIHACRARIFYACPYPNVLIYGANGYTGSLIAREAVRRGLGGSSLCRSFWSRVPVFDRCVSALVKDLHQRGLDQDCTVIIMGEFGCTPRISAQVGRDHWPQVNCALLAGWGMKTGQVIGATNRIAGEAVARPVTFGELHATLYHNLGIDVNRATIQDLNGRPQYLVEDHAQPLRELI